MRFSPPPRRCRLCLRAPAPHSRWPISLDLEGGRSQGPCASSAPQQWCTTSRWRGAGGKTNLAGARPFAGRQTRTLDPAQAVARRATGLLTLRSPRWPVPARPAQTKEGASPQAGSFNEPGTESGSQRGRTTRPRPRDASSKVPWQGPSQRFLRAASLPRLSFCPPPAPTSAFVIKRIFSLFLWQGRKVNRRNERSEAARGINAGSDCTGLASGIRAEHPHTDFLGLCLAKMTSAVSVFVGGIQHGNPAEQGHSPRLCRIASHGSRYAAARRICRQRAGYGNEQPESRAAHYNQGSYV